MPRCRRRLAICLAGLLALTLVWMLRSRDRPPSTPLDIVPLTQAHAHNDYNHRRPLLDALDCGFVSVEADIFLVNGKLLVAHDIEDVKEERSLQALYLDPLLARVRANRGSVFPEGPPFTLLVDVKSEATDTLEALERLLAGYAEMVTSFGPDRKDDRAVTVIVSGNRPSEFLDRPEDRYVAFDGRVGDLEANIPTRFMPLISDRWPSQFSWKGLGRMPPEEHQKLLGLVRKAHEQGKRVRFWSTPDLPSPTRAAVWRELRAAGVDLINTDDLKALRSFLMKEEKPSR